MSAEDKLYFFDADGAPLPEGTAFDDPRVASQLRGKDGRDKAKAYEKERSEAQAIQKATEKKAKAAAAENKQKQQAPESKQPEQPEEPALAVSEGQGAEPGAPDGQGGAESAEEGQQPAEAEQPA